jgi:hypothetical protein
MFETRVDVEVFPLMYPMLATRLRRYGNTARDFPCLGRAKEWALLCSMVLCREISSPLLCRCLYVRQPGQCRGTFLDVSAVSDEVVKVRIYCTRVLVSREIERERVAGEMRECNGKV